MKKLLIVLTNKYPYGAGEPFMENELQHHLPNFDKICFFATDVSASDPQTRSLPEKVTAFRTASGAREQLRRKDKTKAAALFFAPDPVMREEIKVRSLNPAQRAYLAYIEARSLRVTEEIKSILKIDEAREYDEIVLYSYWLYTTANVALYLKTWLRDNGIVSTVKVISRAHGYDLYEYRSRMNYLPFRVRFLTEPDKIYPCSQNGKDYMEKRFPFHKTPIEAAYLGTKDCGTAVYTGKKEEEPFYIVTCSRVVPLKRLEKVVDALSQLAQRGETFYWTHIGGPVAGKEHYYEQLRQYAEDHLPEAAYTFLGTIPNREVYEYYRAQHVDVFLNVSKSEGLPVSTMEAGSFGIPVIATDVGGTAEVIREGENGFLLEKDFRTEELTDCLQTMIREEGNDRTEHRKAARRIWEESFNADVNYKKFADEIAQL